MTTILGIETSCDETGAAIVKNRKICSNVVASQITIHQQYGGVVPEVASRQHLETINNCIIQAFIEANLTWDDIDGIAATCAPGLVGALLVGVSAAKTLALLHQKPFLGVHHLEGHIYASYLSETGLKPPFLCLLVSGGHTSSIHVKDCGKYEVLGTTRDDAAGEAFDKVARLLKLGIREGAAIDREAKLGIVMLLLCLKVKYLCPKEVIILTIRVLAVKNSSIAISTKINPKRSQFTHSRSCRQFSSNSSPQLN